MELLVKNVRIIDWQQDKRADIYINNGVIQNIGQDLQYDCNTIDGEGRIILPSFIDLHCHFRDPGFTYKEDLESGCRAAVKGGYTAVNLMANTNPVCSSMETVNYVLEKSKELGLIDVHQAVSITKNFDGCDISHLRKLSNNVRCISDDGKGVQSSKAMYDAMLLAKELKLTVMCHEEVQEFINVDTRLSENLMTIRDITIADTVKGRLHLCHVSTKEAMEAIINAKKKGDNITCEVAPHHIALTGEKTYRVNPPIREREDVEFLIDAIKEGYVDGIGTDHAPHSEEDKKKGSPGISGIETAFSVCYSKLVREGHISLNKLSEIMSKGPAEILGFNKGQIALGYDGDFTLVDIEKKYKVDASSFRSKGKNTPFDGMELYGVVLKTIKGGKIVYDADSL